MKTVQIMHLLLASAVLSFPLMWALIRPSLLHLTFHLVVGVGMGLALSALYFLNRASKISSSRMVRHLPTLFFPRNGGPESDHGS